MINNGGAGASRVKAAGRLTPVAGHAGRRWLVALAVAATVAVPACAQAGNARPRGGARRRAPEGRLPAGCTHDHRRRTAPPGYGSRADPHAAPCGRLRRGTRSRHAGGIREAKPLQRLHACNGCERGIAARLSADWVLVGWVQFVSNLILNLNVVAIDVETEVPLRMRSSTCGATPNGPGGMPRPTCSITFSWTGSPRAGDGAAARPPTVPWSAPLARLRSVRDRRPASRRYRRDTKRSTSSSSPGHGAPHSRTSSSR